MYYQEIKKFFYNESTDLDKILEIKDKENSALLALDSIKNLVLFRQTRDTK